MALPTKPLGLLEAVESGVIPFDSPFPIQRQLWEAVEANHQVVACLGRRSTKTTTCAIALLWMATCRPDLRRHVLEGEAVYFVSIANTRDQARVALNAVRRLVRRSPLLRGAVSRMTADEIEFENGSIVTAFVCSARGVRGFPVGGCLLDELGWFVNDSEGPAAAFEVWRAIKPSMAQFGAERRLMVTSTPNGDNWFKTVFDDAVSDVEAGKRGVAVLHAATWECNPTLPEGDPLYEEERRSLGEQFDAEYGAMFLGSGSALLAEADIRACVRPGGELDPREADSWVVGADFAWRRDRSAAVVVGHERGCPDRLVVGAIRTWEPAADLSEGTERHQNVVLREVAELAQEYGGVPVFCDTHESQTVQSKLQGFGARCEIESLGSGRKGDVFKELARHVRGGSVSFPEHPLLISELRRLKVKYGGQYLTIENPRAGGGHGDVAMACALGVARVALGGGPLTGVALRPRGVSRHGVPTQRRYSSSEFG